jgi:hypothetical protein
MEVNYQKNEMKNMNYFIVSPKMCPLVMCLCGLSSIKFWKDSFQFTFNFYTYLNTKQ